MNIEIEYTEIKEDIDKLFEHIEKLAKESFEKIGFEIKHISLKQTNISNENS